ncbi:MAG: YhdT family protein [Eubacteriales bacterium]|nr:YhdT family protein [Eubacteriales bacterium]
MQKMTREEKDRQIKKEAKWTFGLFVLCAVWHVGFGYGLSGHTDITLWGLPLWWILSVPGLFVLGVVGVIFLLKKVFVDFDLEDLPEEKAETARIIAEFEAKGDRAAASSEEKEAEANEQ